MRGIAVASRSEQRPAKSKSRAVASPRTDSLAEALAEAICELETFASRDDLIRHLVCERGLPKRRAGAIFGLSPRTIRRITTDAMMDAPPAEPVEPSPVELTSHEIECMVRDYSVNPYMTADEREAAWVYLLPYLSPADQAETRRRWRLPPQR